ncbi:hypothetical protein HYC85_030231 [Camellia sinensis]|uniref:Uncharacterized protein n=1 Tax=Camellia sinensis TaxID=4442 RepID=A0A7J7G042_CAMSI|nr:hypothetical protein HYC85_030231 [Camellia sinensis]
MSPARALKLLMEKGHLKPLDPQPLPDPLPPKHDPTQYCIFHQQHNHPIDLCYRLRHEIQDLIDNKVIAPPSKPNVTTNPLPTHKQGLNDLAEREEDQAELEEDLDNLYFFEEEDTCSVQLGWWDPSQPETSIRWLSEEELDVEKHMEETGKSGKVEAAPLTEKE